MLVSSRNLSAVAVSPFVHTRYILVIFLFVILFPVFSSAREVMVHGRVKGAITKMDLTDAYVMVYNSDGSLRDTVKANMGRKFSDANNYKVISEFYFKTQPADSIIIFDVACDGYSTRTISLDFATVNNKQTYHDLSFIYLDRAPRKLSEVSVTASKIKFYNNGDTLVFNADAFMLPEGSMLDALVSQLPGVELNNDGEIKVNGEKVESLLINGKHFFDGDNNLTLENIAAYTVKNIQVYKGNTREEKYTGDTARVKHLTMDVKLKKEYSIGWVINGQGGYGTDNRYMGRAFISWFSPTTAVSLVGNVNNLNDNRTPGKNDSWSPEQMPSGKKDYKLGGISYDYENPDETTTVSGSFRATVSGMNQSRVSSAVNFLPSGDTYDYSYSDNHERETSLLTKHNFMYKNKGIATGLNLTGNYISRNTDSQSLSATFSKEQENITRDIIEAIYSDGSPEKLNDVLNSNTQLCNTRLKYYKGSISPHFLYNIPNTRSTLMAGFSADYENQKEDLWKDYKIKYGNSSIPDYNARQYTHYAPNHNTQLSGILTYQNILSNKLYLTANAAYKYSHGKRNYMMYALERLADMGVYGTLPADYVSALDPANSYQSVQTDKELDVSFDISYNHRFTKYNSRLWIVLNPDLKFDNRILNYWRDGREFHIKKTNTQLAFNNSYSLRVRYDFRYRGDAANKQKTNGLDYYYTMQPQLPDLFNMIDMTNDTDPLNIFTGNPNLSTQISHSHSVRWEYTPYKKPIRNSVLLQYTYIHNALTHGYTYDTTTGVRVGSMYNVPGNTNKSGCVINQFSWQFGAQKQFILSSSTSYTMSRYADMVGINMEQPQLQHVDYRNVWESLSFGWQIGKQSLRVLGDYTNRHSKTTQFGSQDIDADHYKFGISGNFILPRGFAANADFMCYSRRGYGVSNLDTTDPIWNLRISYVPPRNSHWIFSVDGFDLLHKLSNVSYAVTATGRTVSYTNTLPRYVLLSVQYRLNIQPKKR